MQTIDKVGETTFTELLCDASVVLKSNTQQGKK